MSTQSSLHNQYLSRTSQLQSLLNTFFTHSYTFLIDFFHRYFFPSPPFPPSYCTGSCIVFVPVDVIKERLQVQQTTSTLTSGSSSSNKLPIYRGSFDALLQICKQEGVRGIYKGYGATLLTYGPFSALYFLLYEEVSVSRPYY